MKSPYTYKGTVKLCDHVLETDWHGNTFAVSPKQAKANLAYQFKIGHGLVPGAHITLPDPVIAAE